MIVKTYAVHFILFISLGFFFPFHSFCFFVGTVYHSIRSKKKKNIVFSGSQFSKFVIRIRLSKCYELSLINLEAIKAIPWNRYLSLIQFLAQPK